MREIKFRAYNKIDHLLCDVVEIVFGDDDNYVAVENGEYIQRWRFDDIELMQYTGLKDINGRGIYEGDVVEFYHNDSIVKSGVSYSEGEFIVRKYDWESILLSDHDVKAIGNEFQNPELLEEEK